MFERIKRGIAEYKRLRIAGNTRAMSAGGAIGTILGFTIGGYITASTLPDALQILANQTMWNEHVGAGTATATLGGAVLGLVIIAGTIFVFLKMAGIGGD